MRRSTLPLLVLVLLAAAALAACGDDEETTRTTDDPTPSTGAGGGDGVVITLDVHGGFVPVERAVGNTLDLVVLGDGTVISPAPMIAIFPGPALPPFQVGHVEPAEVDALVAAIEALDPEADYQPPGPAQVADAPDTTLTLRRPEGTVTITAYALGLLDDDAGPRAELQAVVEQLQGLVSPTGEEAYVPTALRVHDLADLAGDPPSASTTTDPAQPGEPTGRILDWPVAHDGRACAVVDDPADVVALLEVLAGATQLDWFATDAGIRRLVVVPALPGDPGCPEA